MARQTSGGKTGLASGGQRATRRQGPPAVAGAFAKQGRRTGGKLKTAAVRRRRKAA